MFGQVFSFDFLCIESNHKEIHTIGHPHAVLRNHALWQIGNVRTVKFRQHFFAGQHFHLRSIGFNHIHRMTLGTSFIHNALNNPFTQATPDGDFDAVFFFKLGHQRHRLGRGQRCVKRDGAFFASPL